MTTKSESTHIYLVLVMSGDGISLRQISAHSTYGSANAAWNLAREELIAEFTKLSRASWVEQLEDKENSQKETIRKISGELYDEMVEKLQCEDPDKIDNLPHATPKILRLELHE